MALCGGTGDEKVAEAGHEVHECVKSVKSDAEAKLGATFDVFEAKKFKQQVSFISFYPRESRV